MTVSRTYGRDVPLEDAILSAFEEAGVDTATKDPPLAAFVDVAALERLYEDAPESLRVEARVWSHPVTVTSDEVLVHQVDSVVPGAG